MVYIITHNKRPVCVSVIQWSEGSCNSSCLREGAGSRLDQRDDQKARVCVCNYLLTRKSLMLGLIIFPMEGGEEGGREGGLTEGEKED